MTFAALLAMALSSAPTLQDKKNVIKTLNTHGPIAGGTGRASVHVKVSVLPSPEPECPFAIDFNGVDIGTDFNIKSDQLAEALTDGFWRSMIESCLLDFEYLEYRVSNDDDSNLTNAVNNIIAQLAQSLKVAIERSELHPEARRQQIMQPRNDWTIALAAVCGK